MDRDVVIHQMHVLSREGTERFQELPAKALDAVERAPDGQWIAASEEARTWAEEQLHDLKHVGARAVLAAIAEAKKKLRAPAPQNALRLLRNYIVERWEHALSLEGMVDYPTAPAQGWDIGSGPTEAMCKNLTLRLKRTGMKWDTDNAAALMNLIALRESGQWEQSLRGSGQDWQTRKIA